LAITPLLKPGEAAKLLGISMQTLRKYKRSGQIRALHLGYNLVRYDPEDVRIFLEKFKTAVPGEGGEPNG